MKEDQKDIFAFQLNLSMLALNCMRGGLHGVPALGQVKGSALGACGLLVFHWPRDGLFLERKFSLVLSGSVARGACDCRPCSRALDRLC